MEIENLLHQNPSIESPIKRRYRRGVLKTDRLNTDT